MHKNLHEAGYHVLAIDMRNHGQSEKRLPSGWGTFEYQDVLGAMDYIEKTPELKDCKVFAVPMCVGGVAFLKAVSAAPDKFKNLTAIATTNLVDTGIAL
eukprot:4976062-Prymnesium_polylepis.1